jgi:TonB dependent receptor-like, beta-barrel/TonB-dependent Receptor Plug Domain
MTEFACGSRRRQARRNQRQRNQSRRPARAQAPFLESGTIAIAAAALCAFAGWGEARAEPAALVDGGALQDIVVTAERLKLIGIATTASEGVVVDAELALAPAYRPGQLLETVPGLDVTSHSGEGKANQYLMRGYNLDHGTDLAIYVDEMPVNEPTHAHGQGYSDVNFLIPELATNIRYSKGTYYAGEGDFASVGAVHLNYLNALDDQIALTAGTLGFQRLFTAGSSRLGEGRLLGALELQHYDGPWDHPDDQRKINAVLRYSGGDEHDGYSLTGMFYHGLWNSTTDQPARALSEGLIGRFGSLDPSDGGQAERASVSARWFATIGGGQLAANGYVINNQLTLWNDFTHFLTDPVNGDQEAQRENRITVGGGAGFSRTDEVAGWRNDWVTGVSTRFDFNDVSRVPTQSRVTLPASADPLDFFEKDRVHLSDVAAYAQVTTHWLPWLRTVVGLREDRIQGSDSGTNPGEASASLFQPKASLIVTPLATTEFYLSAGRGFHSDDLRGVNQAALTGVAGAPLIARQDGAEIGVRQQVGRRLAITLALFTLDAQSETTYNPDVGQDSAGPASRRRGFELNVTYQAAAWLELYASYSADHARFKTPFDDGTGHVGEYLPNAPFATGSFAAYVKELGAWSGGLQYRYLGAYPLSSDGAVRGSGYGEWNGDIRYAFESGWNLALGVYNIMNAKANAAEFWYIDRLPGEPAAGVADIHFHPLEPVSVRLTVSKKL